jgi:hypothetical protein
MKTWTLILLSLAILAIAMAANVSAATYLIFYVSVKLVICAIAGTFLFYSYRIQMAEPELVPIVS